MSSNTIVTSRNVLGANFEIHEILTINGPNRWVTMDGDKLTDCSAYELLGTTWTRVEVFAKLFRGSPELRNSLVDIIFKLNMASFVQ